MPGVRGARIQEARDQTGLGAGRGHLVGHHGAHRGVAFGRGDGVRDADHLAEFDGEVDRGPHVREALGLEGVEEGIVRPAVEHEIELPRQVHRVADSAHMPCPANGGVW
ncbi:MAG: hypothetical protein R2715_04105 [Ilumatobacteraceae bacterium]